VISSIPPQTPDGSSKALGSSPPQNPEKVKEASRQFEALLIGQMLKSMKDSQGGWFGAGEDEASSSAMEYAQEMLAQSLAANGGLGIAKLVVAGLKPEERP
jgi:Rod binding domain-containing protein